MYSCMRVTVVCAFVAFVNDNENNENGVGFDKTYTKFRFIVITSLLMNISVLRYVKPGS